MISAQAQGGKQDVVYAEPIAVSNVQVIQPTGAAPTQPVVAQAYNPSVNNGQYQQQPLQQHYQQQPPQQQYNQQPVYVSQPVKAPQPPPQVVVVQGAATPNPYACSCGSNQMRESSQVSVTQIAVFIILLICFWPLCWIPFCMPSCWTKEYRCASCGKVRSRTEGGC
mmetsp:Transcript_2786/g.3992  ORF Transcript_2786/g.3992 Transcript_2786/m.3992 type:complete len:167 (-) Transcript_2786:106-606(-)